MVASPLRRRELLARALRALGLSLVAGCVWGWLARRDSHASPFVLRPPGAVPEPEFQARCIRCGQCVAACPYGTLRLADLGDRWPLGTPGFEPRREPCRMCEDVPCARVCPSGALDAGLSPIASARMGLAVLIDQERCLSWQGLRCEICHRDCPLQGTAIVVDNHPRRTSRHALFVPRVRSEACTGCGICERVCPLPEPAIKVLPHALAQARSAPHYRADWMLSDEPDAAVPEPSDPQQVPGLDYLNGELP